MTLTNLPRLVIAFLQAYEADDAAALRSLFHSSAVLSGLSNRTVGEAIDKLENSASDRKRISLQPINTERLDDRTILTVLARRDTSKRPLQIDLCFSIQGGSISELKVSLTRPMGLPPVVVDFLQAMNAWNVDGMLECFSDDALVNDQLEEFSGAEALREWASNVAVRDRLTVYVRSARVHHDCVILEGNVDGDYDKRQVPEPLPLSFYFFGDDGKIVQLMILQNYSERTV
jgi:hypothetical protein